MSDDVNEIDEGIRPGNLFQLVDRAHSGLGDALRAALSERRSIDLSRGDLKLLANLDCGTTYTSELARRLRVSRQAINQLLRRPIRAGLVRLETVPDRRNTKWIVITDHGTAVINAALEELEHIERELAKRLGGETLEVLKQVLAVDWENLAKKR